MKTKRKARINATNCSRVYGYGTTGIREHRERINLALLNAALNAWWVRKGFGESSWYVEQRMNRMRTLGHGK